MMLRFWYRQGGQYQSKWIRRFN